MPPEEPVQSEHELTVEAARAKLNERRARIRVDTRKRRRRRRRRMLARSISITRRTMARS